MTRAQIRFYSLKSLIANMQEPRNVRRCLGKDNKRLMHQIITGRREAC